MGAWGCAFGMNNVEIMKVTWPAGLKQTCSYLKQETLKP